MGLLIYTVEQDVCLGDHLIDDGWVCPLLRDKIVSCRTPIPGQFAKPVDATK